MTRRRGKIELAPRQLKRFGSSLAQFMISGAAVLLFSGFILYDTSNILRHYGTDEHVSATLALYLDILNLFIALLSILGIARRD